MKQVTAVFRVFLAAAILLSFAACSGGTFQDPGHEASGMSGGGSGGGGGGGSKPSKLPNNASASAARNKADEIIKYCNDHPSVTNTAIKDAVEFSKTQINSNTWSDSGTRDTMIYAINTAIDGLE
jgi:hypothetical protein